MGVPATSPLAENTQVFPPSSLPSPDARTELESWQSLLLQWNGKSILPPKARHVVTTDASGFGWGGGWGGTTSKASGLAPKRSAAATSGSYTQPTWCCRRCATGYKARPWKCGATT